MCVTIRVRNFKNSYLFNINAIDEAIGGKFIKATIFPGHEAEIIFCDLTSSVSSFTEGLSAILPFGDIISIQERTGTQFPNALENGGTPLPDVKGFFGYVSKGTIITNFISPKEEQLQTDEENPALESPQDDAVVLHRLWDPDDEVPECMRQIHALPEDATFGQVIRESNAGIEFPADREIVQVEIETQSLEGLESAICPLCGSHAAIRDTGYEYLCRDCGARFVVLSGS